MRRYVWGKEEDSCTDAEDDGYQLWRTAGVDLDDESQIKEEEDRMWDEWHLADIGSHHTSQESDEIQKCVAEIATSKMRRHSRTRSLPEITTDVHDGDTLLNSAGQILNYGFLPFGYPFSPLDGFDGYGESGIGKYVGPGSFTWEESLFQQCSDNKLEEGEFTAEEKERERLGGNAASDSHFEEQLEASLATQATGNVSTLNYWHRLLWIQESGE